MNAKSCVEFVLQAMNNVDDEYLNVKIAVDYVGHKEIKRRERVYAYELYHQMRLIQEKKVKKEFTINGEIDKSGHKIIKEPFNPDFVIHQQGKMGENFCVVELKTINKKSGIQKDFHTITCMMHCYRYKIGVFAIAGVFLSDIKSKARKSFERFFQLWKKKKCKLRIRNFRRNLKNVCTDSISQIFSNLCSNAAGREVSNKSFAHDKCTSFD